MGWLRNLLPWRKNTPRRRPKTGLQLAYRTGRGKRVWLYANVDEGLVRVNNSWQPVDGLPDWVEAVLSEAPRKYRHPPEDASCALLVNGKRYQYLAVRYNHCDEWEEYQLQETEYRRRKR